MLQHHCYACLWIPGFTKENQQLYRIFLKNGVDNDLPCYKGDTQDADQEPFFNFKGTGMPKNIINPIAYPCNALTKPGHFHVCAVAAFANGYIDGTRMHHGQKWSVKGAGAKGMSTTQLWDVETNDPEGWLDAVLQLWYRKLALRDAAITTAAESVQTEEQQEEAPAVQVVFRPRANLNNTDPDSAGSNSSRCHYWTYVSSGSVCGSEHI
jgi:hypothetical protein